LKLGTSFRGWRYIAISLFDLNCGEEEAHSCEIGLLSPVNEVGCDERPARRDCRKISIELIKVRKPTPERCGTVT
jgi:hypothetical protein